MEKRESAVLGIDVGGTKVNIGIVSEQGKILKEFRYPQKYSPIEKWTEELLRHMRQLVYGHQDRRWAISAIGIGCRGRIHYQKQKIISTSIMDISSGLDLCKEIQDIWKIPTYIDNDVKAAASAELLFGAGKTNKNFVCYNIGTGIAVAVAAEGKLLRGWNNNAGEIYTDYFSGILKNSKGDFGWGLEEAASGRGIQVQAEDLRGRYPDSKLNRYTDNLTANRVLACAEEGDWLAGQIAENAVRVLGNSIFNMRHLLDPECFVFVGGVASNLYFFQMLKQELRNRAVQAGEQWDIPMELSALGPNDAGLIGAASVALYRLRNMG